MLVSNICFPSKKEFYWFEINTEVKILFKYIGFHVSKIIWSKFLSHYNLTVKTRDVKAGHFVNSWFMNHNLIHDFNIPSNFQEIRTFANSQNRKLFFLVYCPILLYYTLNKMDNLLHVLLNEVTCETSDYG